MNDMTNLTPAQQYQAKMRKRASEMDNEALANFVSQSMMKAEQGMEEAAQRLCDEAGEDRTGQAARAMNTVLRALRTVQAAHCDLSEAQADMIGAPIALRNER